MNALAHLVGTFSFFSKDIHSWTYVCAHGNSERVCVCVCQFPLRRGYGRAGPPAAREPLPGARAAARARARALSRRTTPPRPAAPGACLLCNDVSYEHLRSSISTSIQMDSFDILILLKLFRVSRCISRHVRLKC